MRLDVTKQATRDQLTGWYTREQLEAAFNKVKNPNHWKNPIDAYCHRDEVELVREAVIFFTATVPSFWSVARPRSGTSPRLGTTSAPRTKVATAVSGRPVTLCPTIGPEGVD